MTVTNRLNRATMDGNGVSTLPPIEFPFHSVEDLVVIETILATGAETTKCSIPITPSSAHKTMQDTTRPGGYCLHRRAGVDRTHDGLP
jgi:hypothetical protein